MQHVVRSAPQPRASEPAGGAEEVEPMWVLLAAGSVAGIVGWGVTYPFDLVKSVAQTVPDAAPRHHASMRYIVQQRPAAGGARAFTVGLGTTLVRAVPVNAVTFLVYELALRAMTPEAGE